MFSEASVAAEFGDVYECSGQEGNAVWAPGGVLLLEGRDEADPLVMQFKEATTAVLEPYVGASTVSGSSKGSATCRPPATFS